MPNPYLQQQQDAITGQVTNNLQRNILPRVGRAAMAAGGYGGSRQGIAEGLGVGESSRAIADATANMQGTAYAQDQQIASQQEMQRQQLAAQERMAAQSDATQRYGMGNQYALGQQQNTNTRDLGFGHLGLGYTQAGNQYALGLGGLENQREGNAQNFYTQQRGMDLSQQRQGFDQYMAALNAQMGLGRQESGIGEQQDAAAWSPVNQYAGVLNQFSGLGGSTATQQPGTGGGWAGAAGGALTAAQLWNLLNRPGG